MNTDWPLNAATEAPSRQHSGAADSAPMSTKQLACTCPFYPSYNAFTSNGGVPVKELLSTVVVARTYQSVIDFGCVRQVRQTWIEVKQSDS